MKFIQPVLLFFVLIGLSQWGFSSDTPHVAVLDFTVAQSPGSVDPAVLDFSRAVQAKLFSTDDYAWVERQEFDRISREIDLGGNSRTDPATAVRVGHLLQADLMLRGEITPRSAEASDLTLEVIDLKNADVLSSRVVSVTSSAQKRLHPTAADIDATRRGTVEVLREAGNRLKQMSALRVLAPLYFKNTSKSDRLVFLEERLRKIFGDEATPATGFRVLHFPRVSEAGDESSLVLSGLTDTDPDAWQHVADAYVWGTFSEEGGDGLAFDQVPVTITLEIWNGTGDPRQIKWTGAVKDLDGGLHAITGQVLAAAKSGLRSETLKGNERQLLAANLKQRASDVARRIRENEPLDLDAKNSNHPYLQSTAGRQQYGYWLRLLDVACFFDPMNRSLQRDRLQVAWSPANPFKPADTLRGQWLRVTDVQSQARRFERLPEGALDPFWPKNQAENLAEFVEVLIKAGTRFHVSPEELHHQLRDAVGKWSQLLVQTSEAVKNDASKPSWDEAQRGAWFGQASFLRKIDDPIIVRDALERIWPLLESEFGRMLRATDGDHRPAEYWVQVLFSVYESFADTAKLTAMLDSAWNSSKPAVTVSTSANKARKPASAHPPQVEQPWKPWISPTPAPLPPQAKEASIPVLASSIREIDPRSITSYQRTRGTDFSLIVKRRAYNLAVDTLAFQAGKLWFTEENEVLPAALGAPNPLGAHYLWCYDPALHHSELVTTKLGGHPAVRDLAGANGSMWLGLDGDGVWRLDLENGSVKRFKGEDGLQTSRILSVTTGHDQLYFLGGITPEFFISQYSPKENKWTGIACPFPDFMAEAAKQAATTGVKIQLRTEPRIAVCGDWICFSSDWTAFFNQSTKIWVDLLAAPGTQRTMSSQRITCSSADDKGFWLGSPDNAAFSLGSGDPRSGSIRFIDPNAPANTRSIKIPGLPVAMAHHGPWLWVVLDYPGALSRLGLIDKRSGTFVGQIVLPGQCMRCVVATDERVWVGGNKSTGQFGLWDDGSALLEVVLKEPRLDDTETKPLQPSTYPLHHAVWNGDATAVEALLGKHQNVNEATPNAWTPLMSAAANGRLDLGTRLLAAGANPNVLSHDGDSALQQAALRDDVAFAKLLLQHGANPNLHSSMKFRGMIPIRRPVSPFFDSAPPAQPTGLKASVTPEGEIALSWEDRSNDETQFDIYYRSYTGSNLCVDTVSANVTHWVDPAARDEAELVYTIQAVNCASPVSPAADRPMVRIRRPEVSSRIIRLPYGLPPGDIQSLPTEAVSQSALSTAAGAGYSDLVALLVENGADPDIEDAAGGTPLINAARHREYGIVRQLLAAKANPISSDASGETAASIVYKWHEDETLLRELLAAIPATSRISETSALLFDAAERGQFKDVEMLMSLGGDVDAHNPLGESPLSRALELKQNEAALPLLRSQKAKLKERWQHFQNANSDDKIAEAAAGGNNPEILTLLLEAGLDVNRKIGGRPMVVIAADKRAFAGLEFLLSHGADANAKDFDNKTVKDYLTPEQVQLYLVAAQPVEATHTWPFTTRRTLMRTGPAQFVFTPDPAKVPASEALIAACKAGDMSAAQRAETAGAELDYYDADGKTPLILAIAGGALDLARWLVEEGASVNRPTKKGYSPIAFALETHHPEFIDYLLRAGADINLRGDFAATPLVLAAQKEDTSLLRQLLDAGADPNLSMYRDGEYLSPLAVALEHGNVAAVDLLLAHKANPKAEVYFMIQDNNDVVKDWQPTLLMHAAFGHNIALIKRMISLGQDPAFKAGQGYDALSWAASAGSREAVEFLLPLSDQKGKALENAAQEGHTDIVEILQRANYQSAEALAK